jgi:TonB family protein
MQTFGICSNVERCSKAAVAEPIEIYEGFGRLCPECGRPLVTDAGAEPKPAAPVPASFRFPYAAAIIATVVLGGAAAYFYIQARPGTLSTPPRQTQPAIATSGRPAPSLPPNESVSLNAKVSSTPRPPKPPKSPKPSAHTAGPNAAATPAPGLTAKAQPSPRAPTLAPTLAPTAAQHAAQGAQRRSAPPVPSPLRTVAYVPLPLAPERTATPTAEAATPTPVPTPAVTKAACAVPNADARVISRAVPDYPETVRELGLAGTTQVRVALSATGSVLATAIVRSSGNGQLDLAAVRAARQTSYAPEVRNCEKTPSIYYFAAEFSPN